MAMPAASNDSTRANVATAIGILRQRFGERLQTGAEIRRQHANTITWIPNQPPDAVIWVENADEVRTIVDVARMHRVPIIPFGAGTSLEGHINAPQGGFSVDFTRMNRIIAVNERDLDAVVEPGVPRKQLTAHLRDMGLFFPVDPGAEEATIGGMTSTRASGTTALRYGTMRENVLNITAVMGDGSVVKTAQRARKSAAGYDLTRLMVGAEGTLGVITEVTVRLYGIPETILSAVCPFQTLEGACNAVIQSMQLGLGIARMEVVDEAGNPTSSIIAGTAFNNHLVNAVDNVAGHIDYADGQLGGSPLTGSFTLATIRFRAKAESSGTAVFFASSTETGLPVWRLWFAMTRIFSAATYCRIWS